MIEIETLKMLSVGMLGGFTMYYMISVIILASCKIREWKSVKRDNAKDLEIRLLLATLKIGVNTLNNIRGAIESNQIGDKQIHRLCVLRRDEWREILSTFKD